MSFQDTIRVKCEGSFKGARRFTYHTGDYEGRFKCVTVSFTIKVFRVS